MSGAALAFWLSGALIAYAYVGFPALLWLRSRLLPRPHGSAESLPRVSLVLCARDEAHGIDEKLENLMQLDYPPEWLDVIVASDGSTDGTVARVRARGNARIRVLDLPRRGKIATLNAAIGEAKGEILVFSDANSLYQPQALRALLRPFADPEVGGVAGDQRYGRPTGAADAAEGERAYWDLDRRLKAWQSAAGSVTSATGAIYAVRRELVHEIPAGVTDDFWVSSGVVAQGFRLVFCADAVALEPPTASAGVEFHRKVRIITRGLHAIRLRPGLLDPTRHGFYALQLASHKLLRRLAFVPLAVLLVSGALLWNQAAVFRWLTGAQLVFYALAVAGPWLPSRGRVAKLLALPWYFVAVNAAAACASWNAVRGRRIDSWQPARDSDAYAGGEAPR